MRSFDTKAALLAALEDPTLPQPVAKRIRHCLDNGLEDLTHILVIEPGDTEEAIVEAIGFSPLEDRLHGTRFGDPDFEPDWDWCHRHTGWWELIYTVGNDGFAFLLFVEDAEGVDDRLLTLCRLAG